MHASWMVHRPLMPHGATCYSLSGCCDGPLQLIRLLSIRIEDSDALVDNGKCH
jgi:hypothetical protein